MARPRPAPLTIVELERMLEERRSTVSKLQKQRAELQKRLDALDAEIEAAGGDGVDRTAGGRQRNQTSLVSAIEGVMRAKGPMRVGDIMQAVLSGGYHSTSANFRGIVNQTLIKDQRFTSPGRGLYAMR